MALTLLVALVVPNRLGAGQTEPDHELLELYRQRDFFELRDRLKDAETASPSPERRFLQAALHHAFNRPGESNRLLAELSSGVSELPAELLTESLRLQMENHLRLHDYASALAAARRLVDNPTRHPAELVSEIANTSLLLAALETAPAQTVEATSTTRLKLEFGRRRLAVRIGDRRLELSLDTGANFSVLMRSEAQRAGLTIREVGLEVATSTGKRVPADVAVAERVTLGRAEFRNVVFLVFPDELLTFPDGFRLPGLIGFPVLEALGEIRLRVDNLFEAPGRTPSRSFSNLALDGLEPLVSVSVQGQRLVCRLDTGAGETFFYEPFYRRFRERLDKVGEPRTVEAAGVGGIRKLDALRLPPLTVELARAGVRLEQPIVYTAPLADDGDERLDCNLGLDALEGFRYYAINFRDMALVLGPPARR